MAPSSPSSSHPPIFLAKDLQEKQFYTLQGVSEMLYAKFQIRKTPGAGNDVVAVVDLKNNPIFVVKKTVHDFYDDSATNLLVMIGELYGWLLIMETTEFSLLSDLVDLERP